MSTKRASSLTKRMTPVQWIGVAEGGGGVFFENFNQESQGGGVFFPAAIASGFPSVERESFFEVAHPAIVRDTKRARKETLDSTSFGAMKAGGFENPELAFGEVKT